MKGKVRFKVALTSSIAGALLASLTHLDKVNADTFSNMQTLAAAYPTFGLTFILGLIMVVIILVGVALLLKYRKHLKLIGLAVLIIAVVAIVFGAVWNAQPTVNYWLVSSDTTSTQDNSLTMYAENTGAWATTFDLTLSLSNAHVSLKTSPPYQLVDERTAKFSFTLGPSERQNRQAWYIIDQNATDFYIDLTIQTGGSVLVKSEPGGVTQVSYQKDSTGTSFIRRLDTTPPMPP